MRRKDEILETLSKKGVLSQVEIAEVIFGNREKRNNINQALQKLVAEKQVVRSDGRPARYSLPEHRSILEAGILNQPKSLGDVSGCIITNETLLEASCAVLNDENYGAEYKLITDCLHLFPGNTDKCIVAMKIGLIDITNSTHLSLHKRLINMDELSEIIVAIPNLDKRIQEGDPSVVNEIAKSNGKINLFSFASKFCCYHNVNLYNRDDYSIFDNVLSEYLPKYFPEIKKATIQSWRKNFQYEKYVGFITKKLNELNITMEGRKRKLDHYIWYNNR